jgi:hypothetical protein
MLCGWLRIATRYRGCNPASVAGSLRNNPGNLKTFIFMNLAKKAAARLLRSAGMLPLQKTEEDFPTPLAVSDDNPKSVAYLIGDPILSVPMSLIRYSDGRPFTYEQHHFLQYYRNGLPTLRSFYAQYQPANMFEFFFLDAPRPNVPEWGECPWFRILKPKINGGEAGLAGDAHGWQECGPVSEERVLSEAQRLDRVLRSIRTHGFRPEWGGHVRGYFMLRNDGRWVFTIRTGFHRTAALAHIGCERIDVRLQSGHPRFVEERDAEEWPMVKDGIVTREEALRMFCQFFI